MALSSTKLMLYPELADQQNNDYAKKVPQLASKIKSVLKNSKSRMEDQVVAAADGRSFVPPPPVKKNGTTKGV